MNLTSINVLSSWGWGLLEIRSKPRFSFSTLSTFQPRDSSCSVTFWIAILSISSSRIIGAISGDVLSGCGNTHALPIWSILSIVQFASNFKSFNLLSFLLFNSSIWDSTWDINPNKWGDFSSFCCWFSKSARRMFCLWISSSRDIFTCFVMIWISLSRSLWISSKKGLRAFSTKATSIWSLFGRPESSGTLNSPLEIDKSRKIVGCLIEITPEISVSTTKILLWISFLIPSQIEAEKTSSLYGFFVCKS